MSRYDYRDPGTDPAYCDGLDWRNDVTRDSDPADQAAADIDVPDFDAPEPEIDPAEHCVQAIVSACVELSAMAKGNQDVMRAFALRHLLHQAWMAVSKADEVLLANLDAILERRR